MGMMDRYLRRKRVQEADSYARELVLERWADFCNKADLTIAYTLHTEYGFGKERLKKFFRLWHSNQFEMIEHFRSGDDEGEYWVMEKRLKDDGIVLGEISDGDGVGE